LSLSLPILTFHALDEAASVISFSPRVFGRGMAELYDAGYRTIPLVEVADCLRRDQPFPDKAIAITFDDGYQSVYEAAFPVLQRFNLLATVFLTVGEPGSASTSRLPSLQGRPMLSWKEISEMSRHGVTFGAHTLTHPDLTSLPLHQAEGEIRQSKEIIEDRLSSPVTFFAYPFGRWNHSLRELIRQNFTCACSAELSLNSKTSDIFALERVDAYYLRTNRLFAVMFTKLFPWYILARNIPRRVRRFLRGSSR
jgi:peptidoglycan/xylan/chitin deacetylase (PgdA/CDA1 family)